MISQKTLEKYQVSSRRLASIAAKGIKKPSLVTDAEVMILAASVLSQAKKAKKRG